MAYSEKRKKYANDWYAKNKERLKSLAHRKEAKKIADRKYYLKNQEHLRQMAKEYVEKNKEVVKKRRANYYEKNRDILLAKRKKIRETEAYKIYMREYRLKNKDKISEQQREANKRWMRKQVAELTDAYIINRLCNTKVGVFKTYAEAKKHPELIELTRTKILMSRVKQRINRNDQVKITRDNKRYKKIKIE